jgi:thioredoxin reductase
MNTFVITTAEGMSFTSRKILLATGVYDVMPDLPGFAECWGRSVLHCPYCHGYEVHGQPLGLLGNGDSGYEMVTHIQQWSDQLMLLTNGPSTLTTMQRQVIDHLRILVVETPITAIEHEQGFLSALRLEDGDSVALKAIFARIPFRQHTNLASQLGCALTKTGLIEVTEFGQTTMPGVFAAGDATTPFRQLAMAVTKGAFAGVVINKELITDALQEKGIVEAVNA